MLKTCLTADSKVSKKASDFSFSCSCAFVLAFNDSFSSLVDLAILPLAIFCFLRESSTLSFSFNTF